MECRIEDVYESFRRELRSFFLARTADPASADDLVQETFLRLARHCTTGKGCERPRSYLYAVASNTLIDHHRTPESRVIDGTVPLEHSEAEKSGLSTARSDAGSETLGGCLASLVENLPPPYRDAVRLADLEDLPLKVVASRMGVTVSGAKSRVQRGRSRLLRLIEAMCQLERDGRGHLTRCDPQPKPR